MDYLITLLKKLNSIWIGVGLLALSFFLFASSRSATPLSGDEPFTVYFSQFDVSFILSTLMKESNIPVTYEALLHYWIKLTSTSTSDVRLLPVLFSAATVPALFRIGELIQNKYTGIIAGLFFMCVPLQYEWAHLVRSYSMMICFTTWSVASMLMYSHSNKKVHLLFWTMFSCIAIAAHYLSAIAIFISWLFLLQHALKRKETRKAFLVATTAVITLLSPLLNIMISRYLLTLNEGTYVDAPSSPKLFYQECIKMIGDSTILFIATGVTMLTAVLYSIIRSWKDYSPIIHFQRIALALALIVFFTISFLSIHEFSISNIWMILYLIISLFLSAIALSLYRYTFQPIHVIFMWFVVPFSLMFFMSFKTPMFVDRYISFTAPALYLLIAYSIISLPRNIRPIFTAVVLALLIAQRSPHPDRPIRPDIIMNHFKALHQEGSVAIWSPGYTDLPFTYYYDRAIFNDVKVHQMDTLGSRVVVEEGYTKYKEGLRRSLARNYIFVANDTSQLTLKLDTLTSVVFLDANSEYIYPNNGIKAALLKKFGTPKVQEDLGNSIMLYRFE